MKMENDIMSVVLLKNIFMFVQIVNKQSESYKNFYKN